jgi:hypothetical protein
VEEAAVPTISTIILVVVVVGEVILLASVMVSARRAIARIPWPLLTWSDWKSDPLYFVREFLLRAVYGVVGAALILLALVLAPIYFGYQCYHSFNPSDLVHVSVSNVQLDLRFLCFVAETDDGPISLRWYRESLFGQRAIDPKDTTLSSPHKNEQDDAALSREVQWKPATRYGILTLDEAKVWRLYWLAPAEANPSRGTWSIALPDKGQAVLPTEDFLDTIGLRNWDW